MMDSKLFYGWRFKDLHLIMDLVLLRTTESNFSEHFVVLYDVKIMKMVISLAMKNSVLWG